MNDIQVLVERSEKTVDKMIRPWYARVPGRGKFSKKDKEVSYYTIRPFISELREMLRPFHLVQADLLPERNPSQS